MIAGILLGLGAATCQSLSYVFSGIFMLRFRQRPVVLLVMSHVIMGGISLAALPLVWPDTLPPMAGYGWILIRAVCFYMAGQTGLFLSLRHAEASRVSPLLGLKLPILAVLTILMTGVRYSAAQWLAVAICLSAAMMLRSSGRRLATSSLVWIVVASLGYCFSDWNIRLLVLRLQSSGLSLGRAAMLGAFLCYVISGLLSLCLLAAIPWRNRVMWRSAAPFALAWLAAMLLLFACFGAVGVVFGNIVQSSRGIISILIGLLISTAGYVQLESRAGTGVWIRRAVAAFLMIISIMLFSSGA